MDKSRRVPADCVAMRTAITALVLLAACGTTTKSTQDFDVGTERWASVGATMLGSSVTTYDGYGNAVARVDRGLVYGGRQAGTVWIDCQQSGYNCANYTHRTAHEIGAGAEIALYGVKLKIIEADAKGIRFRVLSVTEQTRIDYGPGGTTPAAKPEEPKKPEPRYR